MHIEYLVIFEFVEVAKTPCLIPYFVIKKHSTHNISLLIIFFLILHFRGEAKCWYGVPGSAASAFEKVCFICVLQIVTNLWLVIHGPVSVPFPSLEYISSGILQYLLTFRKKS